jgi:hypothetical protein
LSRQTLKGASFVDVKQLRCQRSLKTSH